MQFSDHVSTNVNDPSRRRLGAQIDSGRQSPEILLNLESQKSLDRNTSISTGALTPGIFPP